MREERVWQDQCTRLLHLSVGVVTECSPLVSDSETPAGWALADLRAAAHDLPQALMEEDEVSATALLIEVRSLLSDVMRLAK